MNYPARQDPSQYVWSRFPLDPRSSGDLRAGDTDRETARELIAEAYAQGQLSHGEYTERLDVALQAQHLGQLVPLLSDIHIRPTTAPVAPSRAPETHPTPRPTGILASLGMPSNGVLRTAAFVIGVTNLVWAWTSISSGVLLYYWPMWPFLGMVIMVLSTMMFGKSQQQREEELRKKEQQELE